MSLTVGRVKISISVDAALLANIDRYAASQGVTRNAALEHWLGPCEPTTALGNADFGSVAVGVSASQGRLDEVERAIARAIGVPVGSELAQLPVRYDRW